MSTILSHRLNQIKIDLNNRTTRKLIILVPPLILGSYYLYKRIYHYLKMKEKKSNENSIYDAYNYSQVTSDTNSISLNHSDNVDGCVVSSEGKKIRSAFVAKCCYCRNNQKLSFKDSNILEKSLKNLSTLQLVKLSLDQLNNVNRVFDEMKLKQNILKEYELNTSAFDEKIETLYKQLETMTTSLQSIRNEYLQTTPKNIDSLENVEDEDDFDDQSSYISSVTTTSLGYWDPEPNIHFFKLYQDALMDVSSIKPPKTNRTFITGCENYDEFLAKVHCLRKAFVLLFTNTQVRNRFTKIGEEILRIILDHSLRDSNECIKAYYAFLDFCQNEQNHNIIEIEIEPRKIAMLSFYDIGLDYMILESFDDLENPQLALKSVISSQWLSASFREIALQTTVSAILRRKRSKLVVKNGFFEHYYSILDHLSPILAWGFLGTDDNLKFKCESVHDSTHSIIRDYFSFDRCRYTYLEDLCDDIFRVTEERFWELNNKLKIINSS